MTTAEGRELAAFVERKARELDTIEGIDLANAEEATIEMKARQRATAKLMEIFAPLDNAKNQPQSGASRSEFAM